MALNAGTIAVALELDDSNFKLGLDAAKTSLNDYLNDLAKTSGQLSEVTAGAVSDMDSSLSEAGEKIRQEFENRIQHAVDPMQVIEIAADLALRDPELQSGENLMNKLQSLVDGQFGRNALDVRSVCMRLSGAELDDESRIIEEVSEQVQSAIEGNEVAAEMPIAVDIPIVTEDFATQAQAAVESSGANIEVPLDFSDVQTAEMGAEVSAQFGAAGTEAGTAFGTNAAAGILAGSAGITAAVSSVGFAITTALALASAGANTEGMLLASGFASGISAGAGTARANAASMVSGALSAARGAASGAQSIGSMISAGVASGIRSGQSGVVSAAVAMVSAAVAAAKAAAQIHSPSKITTEFGKFWDEGWAVGIEKNTGIATAAATNMVTDTIKAVDTFGGAIAPDVAGTLRSTLRVEPPAGAAYEAARQAAPALRVTGPAIDYDALADAMNQRQVALYMNDRRMARVMATETARAQGARSRSIALGYGK